MDHVLLGLALHVDTDLVLLPLPCTHPVSLPSQSSAAWTRPRRIVDTHFGQVRQLRGIVVSGMEDGWFHSPTEAPASHPAQRPMNPARSPTVNRVKGQAKCITSMPGNSVRAASGPGGNAKGAIDEVRCKSGLCMKATSYQPNRSSWNGSQYQSE